jgi:hypothetical protein
VRYIDYPVGHLTVGKQSTVLCEIKSGCTLSAKKTAPDWLYELNFAHDLGVPTSGQGYRIDNYEQFRKALNLKISANLLRNIINLLLIM